LSPVFVGSIVHISRKNPTVCPVWYECHGSTLGINNKEMAIWLFKWM